MPESVEPKFLRKGEGEKEEIMRLNRPNQRKITPTSQHNKIYRKSANKKKSTSAKARCVLWPLRDGSAFFTRKQKTNRLHKNSLSNPFIVILCKL
jgi:hypothetical protein